MLRMIPRAVALTSLIAAVLAGATSKAQVIDLRYPPYAPHSSARSPYHAEHGLSRGTSPSVQVDHRNLTIPATVPGVGGYPGQGLGAGGYPGAFGPIGQPGAYPMHQQPAGFPGGGFPMPTSHPTTPGLGGGCATGPSSAIGAVDALIGQVGAFLQVFGPTAHCVPQGDCIERDAIALYESAVSFRQAALAGAPPQALAGLYAEMDGACCRLVSRVNRIARGRTGPNIEQVRLIGALCNQIRALI